jgi:uncharacterized damage-inducible protein DinB
MIQTLKTIFRRDLEKVVKEIGSYKHEAIIWHIEKEIPNSAGNLALHLIGNLNHYFGAVLGDTGYLRKRDLEFSQKNVPTAELIAMIQATIVVVDTTLDHLSAAQLEREFPVLVFEHKTSTVYMLIHLATHLDYHLGQINYHRRLLDN